jgi:hypothetical protein
MSYGVIFWGNSTDSKRVFNIQKKIIRITAGVKISLAENYAINLIYFPLLSLLSFVVDNMEKFQILTYTV